MAEDQKFVYVYEVFMFCYVISNMLRDMHENRSDSWYYRVSNGVIRDTTGCLLESFVILQGVYWSHSWYYRVSNGVIRDTTGCLNKGCLNDLVLKAWIDEFSYSWRKLCIASIEHICCFILISMTMNDNECYFILFLTNEHLKFLLLFQNSGCEIYLEGLAICWCYLKYSLSKMGNLSIGNYLCQFGRYSKNKSIIHWIWNNVAYRRV